MGVCNCSMFLKRERESGALLSLSSWCLVIVIWLFLAVPWVCLQFVIVVFPDCIYNHSIVMHVKVCQDILSNRKVMPLNFLKSTNFNVFSLNLVSNRRSSMNLKISVLDYGVVMQVTFLQDDALSNRGEIAIWFSKSQ